MDRAFALAEPFDRYLAAVLRGEALAWPYSAANAGDDALAERLRFHGIAGLLAPRIAALADWPPALLAALREEARMQAFWEESHSAMLAGLCAALAERGVAAVVMKGSALAWSLYADPAARRRGDSDLLVQESDLAATRAVLGALGFALRDNPHGLFFQETWLAESSIGWVHALDLHWRPSDSPLLQRILPTADYFAATVPLPRLSPHAAMPRLALTFIQGALNQAAHAHKGYFVEENRVAGGGRLIWAWDNHLLATAFSPADWEELAQLACARGAAAVCCAALRFAQESCGTPLPEAIIARLAAAPANPALARQLAETDLLRSFWADLAALPSLGERARFVIGHALPSARHLRSKYPQAAHWPVPLLLARRLVEAGHRALVLRQAG